ncbi:MAG: hypothetical protein ACREJ3_08500, partial [Polyangiaceae bacterium]
FSIYQSTGSGHETYGSPTYSGLTQTGGATNTFSVSGLSPATQYCFVVRATDQAGNQEANTHEVCATTAQVPPPRFTSGPNGSPSYTSISVSWAATVNPTSPITYSVCYSTSMASCPGSGSFISAGSASSVTITGLPPTKTGTAYYFVVTATDAGGSTASAQGSATTTADTTPPSVPTGLTLTTDTTYINGISYSWTASTDNVSAQANIGYELANLGSSSDYIIPAGGGVVVTSSYLGTGSSGTHGTALPRNTSASYWIRAIDQAGNISAWASATGVTAASYSLDISPIFNTDISGVQTACNDCHGGGGTYTPGPYSYSFIVNGLPPATGVCGQTYYFVSPRFPESSLIYKKMNGESIPVCGTNSDQMPQGGPYNATNIATMGNWISQGAVNN